MISSASSQKSIRRYLPEELQNIVNSVKQAYDAGLLESEDVNNFMKLLKFRDDGQRYWTIGIKTGRWYTFKNQQWIASEAPNGQLEGAADLSMTAIPTNKRKISTAERTESSNLLEEINKVTGQNFASLFSASKFLLSAYSTSAKAIESKPAYCTECGAALNPNDKFCQNCGSKREEKQAKN